MRKFAFLSSLLLSVALVGGCPMNGDNDNDNENSNQNTNQNDNDDGNDNGGNDNSGNDNGNDNSGNDNGGNDNSGNDNSGNDNSGNDNSGNDNSGNDNAGNDNSGNDNSGNDNSGNDNGNDNDGTVIPDVSLLPGTYAGTADVVTVQSIGGQASPPRDSTMNQSVTFNDDGTIRTVFIPGYSSRTDFNAEISRNGDVQRLIERNAMDQITYRLKATMREAVYDVTSADLIIDLELAINSYNSAGVRVSRLEGVGTHTVSMELVGNQLDIVTETIYDVNGVEPLIFTSREEVDITGTLER